VLLRVKVLNAQGRRSLRRGHLQRGQLQSGPTGLQLGSLLDAAGNRSSRRSLSRSPPSPEGQRLFDRVPAGGAGRTTRPAGDEHQHPGDRRSETATTGT
jgi:hypothetical protein